MSFRASPPAIQPRCSLDAHAGGSRCTSPQNLANCKAHRPNDWQARISRSLQKASKVALVRNARAGQVRRASYRRAFGGWRRWAIAKRPIAAGRTCGLWFAAKKRGWLRRTTLRNLFQGSKHLGIRLDGAGPAAGLRRCTAAKARLSLRQACARLHMLQVL